MPDLIKAEFHCHTLFSKDSLVAFDKLRAECLKKGIQRLVVTDHNNTEGALIAHALDPELFIIGEEIMTTHGELLGIFVKAQIPGNLPPEETIEILRSQAAFISVAHPFDTMRSGHWARENLMQILPQIDAIEVFNSRCIDRQANKIAHDFAQEHQLLVTVGSDSHTLKEVGTSILRMPAFEDADTLREALKTAELMTRMSSPWVHFYSSYARWKKKQMINHQGH